MHKQTRPTILIVVLGLVVVITLGFLFYESYRVEIPDSYVTATATLSSPSGENVGKVTFQESPNGVLIMAEANGLSPGGHAFTIRSVASCEPDFSSAGERFDPADGEHGQVSSDAAGGVQESDLPNIYAGRDGVARADFYTSKITMAKNGEGSVFDADGSAVVVHERPDPYTESGYDTGGRVACGIIEGGRMKTSQM